MHIVTCIFIFCLHLEHFFVIILMNIIKKIGCWFICNYMKFAQSSRKEVALCTKA